MRQLKIIPKEERCSEQDIPDWSGWHFAQCSRRGTVTEEDKLWCFQHAPSTKRKRRVESDERYKADQDRRLAPYNEAVRLRAVNAKLLAALESSAEKLHGLRDEPECLMHLFNECPKSYCTEARDAIESAKPS